LRFLVDNALSPRVAAGLRNRGHDAVHVTERGLGAAADERIFQHALDHSQILISADTDFGGLLRLSRSPFPSLILFRGGVERQMDRQVSLLLANLDQLRGALLDGAIAIFEPGRIRLRRLPLD